MPFRPDARTNGCLATPRMGSRHSWVPFAHDPPDRRVVGVAPRHRSVRTRANGCLATPRMDVWQPLATPWPCFRQGDMNGGCLPSRQRLGVCDPWVYGFPGRDFGATEELA